MKKFLYKVWSDFLTWFGNIKIFKYPLWIVCDPSDYEMVGLPERLADEILLPGDIILRGYNHYADGYLVPGDYSHGGIYVGYHRVIHAESPKVKNDDVLKFMSSDRIVVFRLRKDYPDRDKIISNAVAMANKFHSLEIPYDFGFKAGSNALYCFELCVSCYPSINFTTRVVKYIFGLITRNAYVADSFFESTDFVKVYEHNPRRNIDATV